MCKKETWVYVNNREKSSIVEGKLVKFMEVWFCKVMPTLLSSAQQASNVTISYSNTHVGKVSGKHGNNIRHKEMIGKT